MSATDIKQEMKQSDGDPHTKSRIRRFQREMSKRRMMQDVPNVHAKSQDEIAQRIKEIARENNVPLVENKPLAQALHRASATKSLVTSTKPSPRSSPSSSAPTSVAPADNKD